jgi:hypothetical protein
MFYAMRNIQGCGVTLKADCHEHMKRWPRECEGKDGLVVLTEIFAHELSFSYSRPWRRVVSYNGITIKSLKHLQELWEASCADVSGEVNGNWNSHVHEPTFARLALENDDDLVFEETSAIRAQKEVMETHAISKPYNILPRNSRYKYISTLRDNSAFKRYYF